jgi:hypothetical protein
MAIGGAEVMRTSRGIAGCAAVLGVLALSACDRGRDAKTAMTQPPPATIEAPPRPVTLNVPPPTAPTRPPPVHAELVPPPPAGGGPMVWQPGHWDYTGKTGNPWAWHHGHYEPPPQGETTWVPGRWSHVPNGSWIWLHGHWA